MFICFEGIAGSGKTTQTKLLADYIRDIKKEDVFISATYEGGRRKAVSDFMNVAGIKPDQNAVMLLFQALHAAQYHEATEAINAGRIVIADRWSPSFFAHHIYQNTFRGDGNLMRQLNTLAYRSLEPDIYFLIDTPTEEAYKRYIKREKSTNDGGLELMDLEYFTSVSQYYKTIAKDKGWHIIDGTGNPEDIFRRTQSVIGEKL